MRVVVSSDRLKDILKLLASIFRAWPFPSEFVTSVRRNAAVLLLSEEGPKVGDDPHIPTLIPLCHLDCTPGRWNRSPCVQAAI